MSALEVKWPEHEKMAEITNDSQAIGLFLDTCGYALCEWNENDEMFTPVHGGITKILAGYFEIDLDEIEREKRSMLDQLREANGEDA